MISSPYLKIWLLLVAVLFSLAIPAESGEPSSHNKVLIEYFFQPGCRECELIDNFIMPSLQERYSGFYEMRKFDVGDENNFLKLMLYQDKLKITGNEPVSMIVDGKIALDGYKKIEKDLLKVIDARLAEPSDKSIELKTPNPKTAVTVSKKKIIKRRSEKITLAAVIAAGLVDGVNPCVFSTLVFFISLLSVFRISGMKLLLTGLVYCLACFLSYFALGLGLFRFIHLLTVYPVFRDILNYGMAVILATLAILSFRDAWRYKTSGEASDVTLQLPDGLKSRIHAVMRKGLKFRFLLPGAFAIGVIVTALESVCTGQIYVPTLVLLVKEGKDSIGWLLYLVIYNLAFIIPLLIIFAAAYWGTSVKSLVKWSGTNVLISKIIMGVFFIAMGVLIMTL